LRDSTLGAACAIGEDGLLREVIGCRHRERSLPTSDDTAARYLNAAAARRGITLAPVRDNESTRLVFGMNRKGYIGFFTVPKQD
jgi:hypothetical protein